MAIALVVVVVAALVVLALGVAAAVGSNERGNDNHELQDPPD
jgi:hypothetical protein